MSAKASPSPWIRLALVLISCVLGLGLSVGTQAWAQGSAIAPQMTTDPVPNSQIAGQGVYLQQCSRCHVAIPPAVFPSQTWNQVLQDFSHYGATLDPIFEPEQSWLRRYLRFASRPLNEGESTPYRFRQSRYFRILHPDVDLPTHLTVNSCVSCHPKAVEFNFREYRDQVSEN